MLVLINEAYPLSFSYKNDVQDNGQVVLLYQTINKYMKLFVLLHYYLSNCGDMLIYREILRFINLLEVVSLFSMMSKCVKLRTLTKLYKALFLKQNQALGSYKYETINLENNNEEGRAFS